MNRKKRGIVHSHILLSVALLLFSCKTPADPEEQSIFPLIPETGPVQMLVYDSNEGLSAYDLLTGEEHLFLEPGPVPSPDPGGYPYYRNGMGKVIWHPDGRSVIFEESFGDDEQHLQSLDIFTGEFLFGLGAGGYADLGHVSSDGKTLVLANSVTWGAGNYEIFSMSLDDLVGTRLTNRPGYWDAYPTIHPNGNDIIFQSTPHWIDSTTPNMGEIGEQLYHMTMAGDSITKIELEGYSNRFPSFNSVTGEVVFVRTTSTDVWNTIWKASDMSFTDVVQLTDSSNAVFAWPGWSNDGSKIVYTRSVRVSRTSPFSEPEVWMMNPDGTGQEKLIQNGRYGSLFIRE